jgi:hypothetical protein
MRISALAMAALLTAAPAAAQVDRQPLDSRPLNLPVSLERIREGLLSNRPSILDALDIQATFRVEVEEKRPNFVEMFSPESFNGGPVPPGGLYAYEQQRRLFPNSTPALFTFDTLSVARAIGTAIGDWRRARSETAARAEVERAMAEFCAAQPDGGEGVAGCANRR